MPTPGAIEPLNQALCPSSSARPANAGPCVARMPPGGLRPRLLGRRHRSGLVRFAIGGLALLGIAATVQTPVAPSQARPTLGTQRIRAAAEASALLLSNPALAASSPPAAVAATPASAVVPVPATTTPAASADPMGSRGRMAAGDGRRALRAAASHPIPAAIEGAPAGTAKGDPLEEMAITSFLKTLETSSLPFEIVATSTDPDRPTVRLRSRSPAGGGGDAAGWLAVGQSPAPGWKVIAISRAEVLLLSPAGNPVRLRFPPQGNGR